MENTNCCQSFNERYRKYNLIGKEIDVKNYLCSSDGVNYEKRGDKIQLPVSVCTTSFCNAKCKFCIATNTDKKWKINLKQFEAALLKMKQEDVVKCLSFTGGEPFYDVELLNEAVSMVFDILGYLPEISISTNGTGLKNIHKIKQLQHIDAIHISRHHYNDEINSSIFGIPMPTKAELNEIISTISYKDIFVLNCMLLKDFIHTKEDAHKMLDFAIDIGVPKVSFITCAPVNEYARAQRVEFEKVLTKEDEQIIFTRGYTDFDICHCQDGVYVSEEGRLCEFYGRGTNAAKCSYCRGLVYCSDNTLRTGFSGEILWEV